MSYFATHRGLALRLRRTAEDSEAERGMIIETGQVARDDRPRATCARQLLDPTATCVVRVSGCLRDDHAVQALHRCSCRLLRAGRRGVIVDLEAVVDADTKLVAALVDLLRCARAARVPLQVLASPRVWAWIASYHLEQLFTTGCDRTEAACA